MAGKSLDHPTYLLIPEDPFNERKIGRSHSLLDISGDRNRYLPICSKTFEGQIEVD